MAQRRRVRASRKRSASSEWRLDTFGIDPEAEVRASTNTRAEQSKRYSRDDSLLLQSIVDQTFYYQERLEFWLGKHGIHAVPLVGQSGMSDRVAIGNLEKLANAEKLRFLRRIEKLMKD